MRPGKIELAHRRAPPLNYAITEESVKPGYAGFREDLQFLDGLQNPYPARKSAGSYHGTDRFAFPMNPPAKSDRMDKTLIRQSALKYWKEFLATPAAAAMARNWQKFLRERMQGNQGAYFGFYALPSEFDVMSDLRMLGATVHLPRVLSKTEITFYRYLEQGEPVTALVKGSFGIQEPGPDARPVDPTPADTLIVPSVSANAEGYRLGRGGGYYDRLAEKEGFRQMYKCALIPEKLLDAAFKEESHDLRLNKIVTEERIVSYP